MPTLRDATWRTSTYTNGGGGNCVEIGHVPGMVGIRDTKDRDGGLLTLRPDAFGAFVAAIREGRLS